MPNSQPGARKVRLNCYFANALKAESLGRKICPAISGQTCIRKTKFRDVKFLKFACLRITLLLKDLCPIGIDAVNDHACVYMTALRISIVTLNKMSSGPVEMLPVCLTPGGTNYYIKEDRCYNTDNH